MPMSRIRPPTGKFFQTPEIKPRMIGGVLELGVAAASGGSRFGTFVGESFRVPSIFHRFVGIIQSL
jgi:hypothetical protein